MFVKNIAVKNHDFVSISIYVGILINVECFHDATPKFDLVICDDYTTIVGGLILSLIDTSSIFPDLNRILIRSPGTNVLDILIGK